MWASTRTWTGNNACMLTGVTYMSAIVTLQEQPGDLSLSIKFTLWYSQLCLRLTHAWTHQQRKQDWLKIQLAYFYSLLMDCKLKQCSQQNCRWKDWSKMIYKYQGWTPICKKPNKVRETHTHTHLGESRSITQLDMVILKHSKEQLVVILPGWRYWLPVSQ